MGVTMTISSQSRRWFPRAVLVLATVVWSVPAVSQRDEGEREKVERVADVLTALGVRDGAHVAVLGSADGFYTLRIAKAVAPSGKAYAIDIEQKSLDEAELREAGFEIVDRDDAFTRFTGRTT